MPWVKFETTILMLKWAKTFLALDDAASVKGSKIFLITVIFNQKDILVTSPGYLDSWQVL